MLSVGIQAHPRRGYLAETLAECFDGQAEIVYDPERRRPVFNCHA